MTTKTRILSLALSLLMVVALFAPMATVFAEGGLEIVAAKDNGGTTATAHAKEAIPGLGSGESWYASNRASCPGNVSIATYTLKQSAFVDGVEIAFYQATARNYTFTIEYSMVNSDNDADWTVALEDQVSDVMENERDVEYFEFDDSIEALYIRIKITDAVEIASGRTNNYSAFYTFEVFGEYDPDGIYPPADVKIAKNWANVYKDLHADLYTADSWKKFEDAVKSLDYSANQATVDKTVENIIAAFEGLTFNDLTGLQIAQSYWYEEGSDYNTGENAWTFGSVIFTTPGYTLDQYKVGTMTLANWTRIFAVPTEKAGVYEISNIVTEGNPVTADEEVPENEYGLGFAIAFYTLNENGIDDATASQYASVEFGMRNAAAWEAMKLTVGDKVQLNNIIFTEEQFAEEGEDLQAAWLETEGTWKHRYWDTEGLGSFTKTPIYRGSKVANTGAAEGEPQYLAQDEFVDFVTYSTMTKVNENINYGDTDGSGEVDISDLSQLAQFIAGWSVEVDNAVADVDGNGAVDISDLSLLAQYIAGWSVALGPQ